MPRQTLRRILYSPTTSPLDSDVAQDADCIALSFEEEPHSFVVFVREDDHICPPGVVLAEVPEPLVRTRNLNLVRANSHGLERKNYVRIWAECRPAAFGGFSNRR